MSGSTEGHLTPNSDHPHHDTVERVLRRAEISRLTRNLKSKLAIATMKTKGQSPFSLANGYQNGHTDSAANGSDGTVPLPFPTSHAGSNPGFRRGLTSELTPRKRAKTLETDGGRISDGSLAMPAPSRGLRSEPQRHGSISRYGQGSVYQGSPLKNTIRPVSHPGYSMNPPDRMSPISPSQPNMAGSPFYAQQAYPTSDQGALAGGYQGRYRAGSNEQSVAGQVHQTNRGTPQRGHDRNGSNGSPSQASVDQINLISKLNPASSLDHLHLSNGKERNLAQQQQGRYNPDASQLAAVNNYSQDNRFDVNATPSKALPKGEPAQSAQTAPIQYNEQAGQTGQTSQTGQSEENEQSNVTVDPPSTPPPPGSQFPRTPIRTPQTRSRSGGVRDRTDRDGANLLLYLATSPGRGSAPRTPRTPDFNLNDYLYLYSPSPGRSGPNSAHASAPLAVPGTPKRFLGLDQINSDLFGAAAKAATASPKSSLNDLGGLNGLRKGIDTSP